MADSEPPPAAGGGEWRRPGILIRSADLKTPFKDSDLDLLESRVENKIGDDKVKQIEFSADKMEAYVELEDAAGKYCVLRSNLSCSI